MNNLEWAHEMCAKKATVLHSETDMIGTVIHVYDRTWVSPINGVVVDAVVIKLDTGHAFIVPASDADDYEDRQTTFFVLTPEQATFYLTMQRALAHSLKEAAVFLRSKGIDMDTGMRLIVGILKTQILALSSSREDTNEHFA